jgi:alpha-glucosidase
MVWEKDAPNAGFSDGKPWLPVKEPQAAKAVDQQQGEISMLSWYKKIIAFRKATPALTGTATKFLDLPEPILAFHRSAEGQELTCVFNLSKDTVRLSAPSDAQFLGPHHASLADGVLELPGNGYAILDARAPLKLAR